MKKALAVLCLLTVVVVAPVSAQDGPKLGAGAFVGLSFPVLQDDQGQGIEYGFKGRIGLGSLLVLEPYVAFTQWGEPDPVDDIDLGIDGSKVTSFGVEASLGNLPGVMGVAPFFTLGGGSYKVENDDTGYESSKLGMSVGLGIGYGMSSSLSLDIRGKAIIVPQEEGGSKKAVGASFGLNYGFGGN